MLNKVSFFALVVLLAGACSESKFKAEPNVVTPPAPKPKVADSTVETNEIKPTEAEAETVVEEKVLKDKCDSAGVKVLEQKISFPEKFGCAFTDPNPTDNKFNEILNYIETSTATLNLPQGEVCDVAFETQGDVSFQYDDVLIFTLDDYILFSSTNTFEPFFETKNNFPQMVKSKLLGQKPGFDGQALCIKGAKCTIPPTDKAGILKLDFPFESISSLIQLYKGKPSVPLNLSVTGDNDLKDCSHSKLDLVVKMKYVP